MKKSKRMGLSTLAVCTLLINVNAIAAEPIAPAVNSDNNSSGSDTRSNEEKENDYKYKVFTLASISWGMSEVGTKYCKPSGAVWSPTLINYWESIVGNRDKKLIGLLQSEKDRDALLKRRVDLIKKAGDALLAKADENLQVASMQLQIESLNAQIDSISGSTLFGLDNEQSLATSTARIPTREIFILATLEATSSNDKENLRNVETFNKLIEGIGQSVSVATTACQRTKKVEVCTQAPSASSVCVIQVVPAPVPGSCETARALPVYQNGVIKDYATIYTLPQVPSIQLNERMGRLEELMKEMISMYPVSNDSNFDWTTPLVTGQKNIAEVRKSSGALCPSTATEKDYDFAAFEKIAPPGNDPFMEMGRNALGVNLNQVEYEFVNRFFEKVKKDKNLTDYDAKRETWAMLINSTRGVYYLKNNKPQNANEFTKEEQASYELLAKGYSMQPNACATGSCNYYKGEKRTDVTVGNLGSDKLSDNARAFLAPFGITGDSAELAVGTFNHNWNLTDLLMGQPGQRNAYFKFTQGLTIELLAYDKEKLNGLLVQKQKLNDYSNKVKLAYQNGGNAANINNSQIAVTTSAGNVAVIQNSSDSTLAQANAVSNNLDNNTLSTGTSPISLSSNPFAAAPAPVFSAKNGSRTSAASLDSLGALSSNSQAIAKKIEQNNAQVKSRLKLLSSSNGSKKSSLASNTANEKSSKIYDSAINKSSSSFFSKPESHEISKSLSGEGSQSVANSPQKTITTNSTISSSSSNGDSFSSFSSSASGSLSGSGGSNSKTTMGSAYASNSVTDGRGSAGVTMPSHTSGTHKRFESIELFETISAVYKRIGYKRLGLDK